VRRLLCVLASAGVIAALVAGPAAAQTVAEPATEPAPVVVEPTPAETPTGGEPAEEPTGPVTEVPADPVTPPPVVEEPPPATEEPPPAEPVAGAPNPYLPPSPSSSPVPTGPAPVIVIPVAAAPTGGPDAPTTGGDTLVVTLPAQPARPDTAVTPVARDTAGPQVVAEPSVAVPPDRTPPVADTPVPAPVAVAPATPAVAPGTTSLTSNMEARELAPAPPADAVRTDRREAPAALNTKPAASETGAARDLVVTPAFGTGDGRSAGLLQVLAGYAFPGVSNQTGAILLLFPLALLLTALTPRLPRLHLRTIVSDRGAGPAGFNAVALRPG
jgi:hypothetical protein